MTTNPAVLPEDLLEAAYEVLGYREGSLVPAAAKPDAVTGEGWVDRGDWQTLAAQVGAENLFFVGREPVIVFARTTSPSSQEVKEFYNRIWCMSRPHLLFLATPGHLAVYDLTKPPTGPGEELGERNRLITAVTSLAEVQEKLAAFHRERVETGIVFGDERFRDTGDRSDRALIRDLRYARQQLGTLNSARTEAPPELSHLHSLIGRAIFIRYLEDREVLLPSYFDRIAEASLEWQELLSEEPTEPAVDYRLAQLRFVRVLRNKEFTYALFDQLAKDFNGDTFPLTGEERSQIDQAHLDALRDFLLGSVDRQQHLFFFAYRFDVVPIELISTIYEEFYNERTLKAKNKGAHYTPPALVEFVLATTLTVEVLASRPRVLDPACGSGIFIVEAFRRVVRHLTKEQHGRKVNRLQLRKILRDQIAGIDINEEAIRVAAFSLYLAFLHYQDPREINDARRLPFLKWVEPEEKITREKQRPGAEFFDVLLHANAFDVVATKTHPQAEQRFGPGTVQVIVGNPPWGYPAKIDVESQAALKATMEWCSSAQGRPVGDKELSQAFIHLSQALLPEGGRAGLLVSSGVLFKSHPNSCAFRRKWLQSARIEQVVNFAHVRHVFFSGDERSSQGISPFVSVVFRKGKKISSEADYFQYWSAKRTEVIQNTKAVVLSRGDMHWLSQDDCERDDRLWKIYWWGGHRDAMLIRRLDACGKLQNIPELAPFTTGRGYQRANRALPAGWLKEYRALPISRFERYSDLKPISFIDVPDKVERRGAEAVYKGRRLLVGRGIREGGVITTRIEERPLAFTHAIHGVRLDGLSEWQEDTVQAVFWSSLARYYFFMVSGSWGLWHDELNQELVGRLPMRFSADERLRARIAGIVKALRGGPIRDDLFAQELVAGVRTVGQLEVELDEAVFDLFSLSRSDRALIRDLCSTGLDLFYKNEGSEALRRVECPRRNYGTEADVHLAVAGLAVYLAAFLSTWNKELGDTGEFSWRVLSPRTHAPLLAVSFKTKFRAAPLDVPASTEEKAWGELLEQLETAARLPLSTSQIYIDSFFSYVSDDEIVFIKRNERRFWSEASAYEDAESSIARLMDSAGQGAA